MPTTLPVNAEVVKKNRLAQSPFVAEVRRIAKNLPGLLDIQTGVEFLSFSKLLGSRSIS